MPQEVPSKYPNEWPLPIATPEVADAVRQIEPQWAKRYMVDINGFKHSVFSTRRNSGTLLRDAQKLGLLSEPVEVVAKKGERKYYPFLAPVQTRDAICIDEQTTQVPEGFEVRVYDAESGDSACRVGVSVSANKALNGQMVVLGYEVIPADGPKEDGSTDLIFLPLADNMLSGHRASGHDPKLDNEAYGSTTIITPLYEDWKMKLYLPKTTWPVDTLNGEFLRAVFQEYIGSKIVLGSRHRLLNWERLLQTHGEILPINSRQFIEYCIENS